MSHSGKLLIVEDDAGIRALLTAVANLSGMECIIAGDGEEALEALGDGRDAPAVILLDLVLPKVDGLHIARHLGQNAPHLLRRIIVITAANASVLRECPELKKAWCFRRKPLDINDLMEQISRCAEAADEHLVS